MATEPENPCAICLESWDEASYVLPCLHRFCYSCILQWVESKPECPLCKRRLTSIVHSVRGDDDFEEHVLTPPVAPSVVVYQTGGAPAHPAAHNNHGPASSQPSVVGLVPRPLVGSFHPHVRAFQVEDPALLQPLLPWLQLELGLIFEKAQEAAAAAAAAAQRLILSSLQLFGLDEENLFRRLREALGRHTRSFVRRLIDSIVRWCSWEAQGWMGLGDARGAEERERSRTAARGPAASRGGPPAHSPGLRGEQEDPHKDQEKPVPRPSAPSWHSQHSPGRPRRAPKRRASSPEDSSQPPKKRRRCRHP